MMACLSLLWSCEQVHVVPEEDLENNFSRFVYLDTSVAPGPGNTGTQLEWSQSTSTVLAYGKYHEGIANTFDTDYTEYLTLEVPSDVIEFDIARAADMEVLGLELYYTRSCECSYERFEFDAIEMSGKRISADRWELTFDVTVITPSGLVQLQDSGPYQR